MSGKTSKNKGANGEREVAKLIEQNTSGVSLRRNLEQTRGGGYDLVGIDGLAIEVKRVEKLALPSWKRQALRQANETNCIPILVYRQNRKPWTWLVGTEWDEMDNETFFIWLNAFLGKTEPVSNRSIIGLMGYSGCGKTLASSILTRYCPSLISLQLGYALKKSAMAMCDLTWDQVEGINFDREAKLPGYPFSVRELLDYIGTDFAENVIKYPLWTHQTLDQINTNPNNNILITDIRRPPHVEFLRGIGGTLVRIDNISTKPKRVEGLIQNYEPDIIIINTGESITQFQEELITKLRHLIK